MKSVTIEVETATGVVFAAFCPNFSDVRKAIKAKASTKGISRKELKGANVWACKGDTRNQHNQQIKEFVF